MATGLASSAQSPMGDPSDIAAELQSELGLTNEQMAQLTPVLGGSIRSMISLVMNNADKRMGVRQKLQMAKSLKKIKSDTNSQMNAILSPQQQQALQAYRDQRQG